MCLTCGCGSTPIEHHHHHHTEEHSHSSQHEASATERILLEHDLLAYNQRFADANRKRFAESEILALNFLSSPGAGKTSLIIALIKCLQADYPIYVIEGDQATELDAMRVRETGVPVVQINTGKMCHLDAHQVAHALDELKPSRGALLLIENVGNLICPAAFDLGEDATVALLSVTEGSDKPLKYPDLFAAADALILHKSDLLAHVDFSCEEAAANARRLKPKMPVFLISSRTQEGLENFCAWLKALHAQKRATAAAFNALNK